jgi:hypothetical protein
MTTVATANIEVTAGGAESVALKLLNVDKALGGIIGTGADAASALAPVAGGVAAVDAGFLAVLADAPAALGAMGEAAAANLGALSAVAGVVSSLRSAWAWLLEHPRLGLAASISVSGGDGGGESGPTGQTGRQFFQGGRILVGETGPELVTLPRGSQIHPAGDTRDALGGGNGGAVIELSNVIELDGQQIGGQVVRYLVDRGVDVRRMTGGVVRR